MADAAAIVQDALAEEEKEATTRRALEFRDNLVDVAGLATIPQPLALIEGLSPESVTLAQNCFNILLGLPESCKSFVAIDMACCITTGAKWHGRKVAQGPVLYVAAEGTGGLSKRVDAWLTKHQRPVDDLRNLQFLTERAFFQFGNALDIHALVEVGLECKPTLIVIDTQAQTTVGLDENSAKDMGRFIAGVKRLQTEVGCASLVLHHPPRGGDHPRGSSALEGAAEVILNIEKKDTGEVTLKHGKRKDFEKDPPMFFDLVSYGRSAALVSRLRSGSASEQGERLSGSQFGLVRFLQALGPNQPGLSFSTLAEASSFAKSTVSVALKALTDKGYVVRDGDLYRCTPAGRAVRLPPE